MPDAQKLKVLIVCLGRAFMEGPIVIAYAGFLAGNICRSPMGEAILKDIAQKRSIPIEVDSCGTGSYHIGEEPDERYNIIK